MARQFLIKVKGKASSEREELAKLGSATIAEQYEQPMKGALGDVLLPDFVVLDELQENADTDTTTVTGVLNFEGAPDAARVAPRLSMLTQVETEAAGDKSVRFKGALVGTGHDKASIAQRLKVALSSAADLPPLSTPFVESTYIGARVGTELRDSALRALLISFVAIVLYLRVRFREYRYGLSAVIALIHDTAIVLGIVVLVNQLGWLDIELDLSMIAAFLTIIGYSMNDTIVLFDRVRENLPRMNAPLYDVIDASMNQVLARSLLTSFTVLLTLIVIFVMNIGKRNVLEGFSFCMIVGVIVGTYSSIYVASPFLLIFSSQEERAANAQASQHAKAAAHEKSAAHAKGEAAS
jgi:preprotein translocase SecF subunit